MAQCRPGELRALPNHQSENKKVAVIRDKQTHLKWQKKCTNAPFGPFWPQFCTFAVEGPLHPLWAKLMAVCKLCKPMAVPKHQICNKGPAHGRPEWAKEGQNCIFCPLAF